MTINLIFKIAAVGILVSVLGQVLKHSGREEQAFLVSLAGLILVLLWVVPYIQELFQTIEQLTLRIERARKGVQDGKELRDDRVDQAGRWGKECRSTMLKVAVIGVMGALLALLLKGEKAGQSLWVVLAACLLIMGISLSKLENILTMIREVEEALGSGALYLQVLLKMIGISYIAEFGAEICKDAGFGALAGQIEFFGKIMLLAVSIPIIQNLITLIGQMGI